MSQDIFVVMLLATKLSNGLGLRVSTAAQLISETTANALEFLFPKNEEMWVLARFIRLADKWFDLMNSYTITHKKSSKNAFGLDNNIDEQMKVIEDFKKEVSELRVGDRTVLIDWQQGIIQSLNALPKVLEDLKSVGIYGVL